MTTDPKPEKQKDEVPTFTVEDLRDNGAIVTGFHLADVRGALSEMPAGRKLTVEAATKAVADWLQKPVESQETPQPDRAL